eukprot:CAMPEP_0170096076 /NCGR_PEP_ID=MMETSP0019_2-20121128/28355_1 /TAXON_ID=98059 /ORGANISM="Dinobryon sp., Strain UTEXLB2267" /LENGTH=38 /DNA_ID= /DNA_START= /DNA_END= /DNA_ORIENTATION=
MLLTVSWKDEDEDDDDDDEDDDEEATCAGVMGNEAMLM